VRLSNKLAREAANVLELAAFRAIGMALDLDADATEEEFEEEFYEAASERLPEEYFKGALNGDE
jgi:hypothetical protein